MPAIALPDRSFLRLHGPEAEHFINNLVTADVTGMEAHDALPAALLTPQGKILFEFLIWRDGADLLLEVQSCEREALLRRLTLYKLRAQVTITLEETEGVTVCWDEPAPEGARRDRRFAAAGLEVWRVMGLTGQPDASPYHRLRIAHGIAEAGLDYPLQDAFPHDVLMDVNGGVSFKKGCYVGQEVVSRMHHRKTARRRVATVTGTSALPATGTALTANGKPLGTLGTVIADQALAIIRIDRAGEAMAAGVAILAGDVAVTVHLPAWTGLSFPTTAEEEA
ncbi:CAF17-like 4Fe-4S cluster assembly/insertion protein YgfZ [Rhizobium paknamense]|uniref:Folate-binding protein YgfZ n=1 Tax=Rhizobium paknamense TaxID=1206817 RepID=A0ABU0I7J1_9HYPH|nr:folate-binding protein YgfZ [Rhizobium paknamense]MDQ0454187.1 folate-binding protein YgfZ [Rhizobium paknamense]